MPSHYLNHSWLIVNWTLRNKLQWITIHNTNIFIEENALEIVCEMAAILSRPQCVKTPHLLEVDFERVTSITLSFPLQKKTHGPLLQMWFNSLAPGKFEWNFRHVIFKQILVIDGWGISCEIAPIWMSLDFTDDQSTLVQVMAWCRQATSHYLSQYWPRSLLPYGITRPQWVHLDYGMDK